MPEKLDRCVADVKAKGDVKNPWAVCKASIGDTKTKEANQNRRDPYPSPDIKKGKVEPVNNKTPKGIGGLHGKIGEKKRQQEALLIKQILDTKLRDPNARHSKSR